MQVEAGEFTKKQSADCMLRLQREFSFDGVANLKVELNQINAQHLRHGNNIRRWIIGQLLLEVTAEIGITIIRPVWYGIQVFI